MCITKNQNLMMNSMTMAVQPLNNDDTDPRAPRRAARQPGHSKT